MSPYLRGDMVYRVISFWFLVAMWHLLMDYLHLAEEASASTGGGRYSAMSMYTSHTFIHNADIPDHAIQTRAARSCHRCYSYIYLHAPQFVS